MVMNYSYIGSSCDIYRMNDNIVASGVVSRIDEDYIIITGNSGNLALIKPQTMVKVAIRQDNTQSDVYVALIAGVNDNQVKVTKLQRFNDFDKREYFRLNVMINSRIQLRNAQGVITETIMPVKVRDLSLRGVFFVAKDNSLLPGQQFDIILPLSETYTYTCTIRRKVDYYRSIGYGCSFNSLDSKQEDCLCNYLFEQQRKEILRVKNQMGN